MLQRVFLDQLAIDVGAIGAVEILKEGVIEDIDYERVVSTDRRVIDTYIVVRQTTNRVPLFGHVVFSQDLVIQAQN
jgi:hypothetical protein